MTLENLIYAMTAVCILLSVLYLFSKPLKLLGKVMINSVIGIFAFIGTNFLLGGLGVSVGVNLLTVLIVGILGVPGFICLYISQLFLN